MATAARRGPRDSDQVAGLARLSSAVASKIDASTGPSSAVTKLKTTADPRKKNFSIRRFNRRVIHLHSVQQEISHYSLGRACCRAILKAFRAV